MARLYLVSIILLILSCKTSEPVVTKSSKKEISSLALSGISNTTSTFDQASNTYTFTVPIGTNIKSLVFTFTLPFGATSMPASGSTQDFTNPVIYTVTAEDGSKQIIKIVVIVQTAPKSSQKQILSFSFDEISPVIKAVINETTLEISAEIPSSINLKALRPSIKVSEKAIVSPVSGTVQDFTNEIKYTVTAEDGTMQIYKCKIIAQKDIIGGSGFYIVGIYDGLPAVWKNNEIYLLSKTGTGKAVDLFVNDKDIYIVGSLNEVATLWKNGIPITLSNSKNKSEAISITAIDNDIFIIGNDGRAAKLWKNSQEFTLTNDGFVSSLITINKDVFIAGTEYKLKQTSNGEMAGSNALIWKNDKVFETLNKSPSSIYASSINIVNSELSTSKYCTYWSDYTTDNMQYKISCAPNTTLLNLVNNYLVVGEYNFFPRNIAINNDNIFVYGSNADKSFSCASYFRLNRMSTLIQLENDCNNVNSSASSVKFSNDDMYFVGTQLNHAICWKNGKYFWTADKSKQSSAINLFIK